ncbi:unnamed protein product [Darwinula stevensoni]|uniref:Uncharacterized protein n=1 Tax=Darwinula stevensoni TaxID=69355 RepID=A0A7R9A1X5_9CRUS|nr:unnamed protein product [Darwinula stevensoni]CAG0888602.1 unnamed protein product [Darwinula stevensoni]
MMEAFSRVDDSLKQRITSSLKNLIWRCTFQGTNCLQDGFFQKITTPQYGACYMFNTAWNPNDSNGGQRISGKTGEETGLSLEVFIDQTNYMKNTISASAGARVTIHSPDQLPNPVEQGYFVQPNTHTVFGLQIVNMSRLSSPYVTNCISNWTETDFEPLPSGFNQNISNQNFSFGYSQVQCERLRLTAEIADIHRSNPLPSPFDSYESRPRPPPLSLRRGGRFCQLIDRSIDSGQLSSLQPRSA